MTKVIPASELIINPDGSIYHLNLKPEFLASNVITVGDPERVPKISQYFDHVDIKVAKREFVTHTGTYKGKRLSVMSTGMGTDNIEIFMTELDALVNIDLQTRQVKPKHTALNIVRVGTSGSMREEIPAGALVASEYAVGLDTLMQYYAADYSDKEQAIREAVQQSLGVDFLPYCFEGSKKLLGQMNTKDMILGNTATCPGFFGPQGREVRLKPAIPDIIERLSAMEVDGFQLTNFEMETAGYYAMGKMLGHEVLSLNAIVANRITHTFVGNPSEVVDHLIHHTLEHI
ncbi:nucleoside phosphorylase [Echinicola vietnamensis]|uniref:Uridine phosphorylase n=1 Tax=Echinicola vietnamensis (strain DSM 17526 / LMG 23754 / KMM 6221) TaxID=926556 RepID=L0FXP8_ECHVK|nr:nucleoside phosphorylase [Echinicola vietnamensis]AGA78057.1 uridine phosphorylase [Echinicola vietnamensis DSM 17526]